MLAAFLMTPTLLKDLRQKKESEQNKSPNEIEPQIKS